MSGFRKVRERARRRIRGHSADDYPQPARATEPRNDSVSAEMVDVEVEVNDVKKKPSYPVSKNKGVWMADGHVYKSAARAIAENVIQALGLFEGDFQTRDKIISAISDRLDGMLDYVARKKK